MYETQKNGSKLGTDWPWRGFGGKGYVKMSSKVVHYLISPKIRSQV